MNDSGYEEITTMTKQIEAETPTTEDTTPIEGPTEVLPTYAERVYHYTSEGLTEQDARMLVGAEVDLGIAEPESVICTSCGEAERIGLVDQAGRCEECADRHDAAMMLLAKESQGLRCWQAEATRDCSRNHEWYGKRAYHKRSSR